MPRSEVGNEDEDHENHHDEDCNHHNDHNNVCCMCVACVLRVCCICVACVKRRIPDRPLSPKSTELGTRGKAFVQEDTEDGTD